MPVELKVQLVSVAEDGSESTEDLLVLTKEHERLEQLGLTLAEGKQLLRAVQRRVVQQQVTAFLAAQAACPTCGRQRGIKDHKTLGLRTLFGKLSLDSPRVRQCCRQSGEPASISPLTQLISERSTPELQLWGGKSSRGRRSTMLLHVLNYSGFCSRWFWCRSARARISCSRTYCCVINSPS
jgi:hypothetical protein